METKKFLEAMNGIDGKYIQEADIFAPEHPKPVSPVFRVLRWAGTAAACLLVTAGVVFVCVMNLLTDTGTPVARSNSTVSAQPGAPVPLSELPELSFPTREELGDTQAEAFEETDRDMVTQGLTERMLTAEEVASIWGQETLSWEGVNPEDAYDIVGIAYVDDENEIELVTLWGYDKSSGTSAIFQGLHSFFIDIRTGGMPAETLVNNAPAKSSQIWETEVTTTSAWYNGESHLTAEFLREGEEPVGLRVYASAQENNPDEEALKELLTRLVSQCLRPESTLQISQLETGVAGSETEDGQKTALSEPVAIDKQGNLTFPGTYTGEVQTVLYEAFGDGPAETGDEVSAAYQNCKAVVHLCYPAVAEELLPSQIEKNRDERIYCKLMNAEYAFYEEQDGTKYVKETGGYNDLASVLCHRDANGRLTATETWLPKDGSMYEPSVLELCGGSSELSGRLLEWKDSVEWPQELFEDLLVSWMEQNGMSGWVMRVSDGTNVYDRQIGQRDSSSAKKLTLYDVISLSQKGTGLTWEDFEGYDCSDIGRGGETLTLLYPINSDWDLQITAPSADVPPEHIALHRKNGGSIEIIDITDTEYLVQTIYAYLEEEKPVKEEILKIAKEAATEFATQQFSDAEHPLSDFYFQNAKVVAMEEEKQWFLMSFQLVFKPEDPNDSRWQAGNTKKGTGELEGYFTASRYLKVEVADSTGQWKIAEAGTGGYSLEGLTKLDWAIE